ncbi:MAG: folate-binding protein [Candidatus Nanopelagicales bacterium]|nr:folate-binding protein [Candidatus Nanopelagicales bacterium]MDZ4249044.1 folate-binding protein [Candidatus Nanopelagicales bacterium]
MNSLDLPDACAQPEGGPDAGVAWHFGDPLSEQRWLVEGTAVVDLSDRGVIRVEGPDRLTWLDDLTTAKVSRLPPGESRVALILSPHGRVEHELHLVDDGDATWLIVEPGTVHALVGYLNSMRFLLSVDVIDASEQFGVLGDLSGERSVAVRPESVVHWTAPAEFAGTGLTESGADRGGSADRYVPNRPGVFPAREWVMPRRSIAAALQAAPHRAGTWAWEAVRVAAAVPRIGMETDARSLPHEVGWIGSAVHLAKGCYRGQEAVARTHNMGRPPRRLVLLHLGSSDELPAHGTVVRVGGSSVGWIATSAIHFELGPISTAVVKRSVPSDAEVEVDGATATQVCVVVA